MIALKYTRLLFCQLRMDLLESYNSGSFSSDSEECELDWHNCALQLLANNNIAVDNFAGCAKELLVKGRRKFRNVMLTGPANCGKTFLLNPLNKIFNTFTNPASTSFAWVGAEKAEVVFVYVKGGVVDERETEMMAVRWKMFNFNRQIPQDEQREIKPCAACFACLILEDYDCLV